MTHEEDDITINSRMIIELRPHQRAFIKAQAKAKDCSMTKVIRELVEKEMKRKGEL